MRFASHSALALVVLASLGFAVACGDDDTSPPAKAGSSATGGKGGSGGTGNQGGSPGDGGATAASDSQLCQDLGGPAGIDAVVRGDGKTSKADPFNGFKFEKSGRQASVLLNVATDPCIGQQFASLLTPARAAALEHLAECLSLFVQNAAGCAVPYEGATDKAGKVCRDMKSSHLGLNISEDDYAALVTDAATALIAAGVAADSPQFMAVAGALTSEALKKDIITNPKPDFSRPGDMCVAAGGADGGAGAGAGGGGAGGAP